MLLELGIRDFAIIDEIRLRLEPGFNALTGETGAGKSILIDALGAVLGDRVGSDVVRTGAKSARVEAVFDLEDVRSRPGFVELSDELGIDPDEEVLILAREIQAGGRSLARINGATTTAGALGRIGTFLVDVHGQSDHLSLLRPDAQLDMLDRYAGLTADRQALAGRVRELMVTRRQIAAVERSARDREQRLDLLRFQVEEITSAALTPGEDLELEGERARLANAERLTGDAVAVHAALAGVDDGFDAPGGALPALREASGTLDRIAAVDVSLAALAERLREALFLVEDLAVEIRDYGEMVEHDPARLEAVEDRLDLIRTLKRKYGTTIEQIIAHGEEASAELEELTGGAGTIEALRGREAALATEVGDRASALSRERGEAGIRLASAVEGTIADLRMGSARFVVGMTTADDPDGVPFRGADGPPRCVSVTEAGADRIEFLIAPNRGEALKPLARVASGGETARLMLAMKSILSEVDATPTLVFDEVDVGVGGRSGQVVGEKLFDLSAGHQVLVITHLPQIAAFADSHFRIAKAERDGRVISRVEVIEEGDRIEELAAMLDGLPVSEASRESAREMVRRAANRRGAASAV
ncbi:MAG: DNA repair protein RecN [uncultured Thermomicrobiales bacterium]|uniref:DNA repair protein RecN n=1 Tax=uncultured Thermomicrobiales bacterium TaxID=1645740 RepID=A0A6J4UIR2_9BACT|nr:MAG: DNA repair protein RecN [uncultured Thermomicrobiales bacterium]